MDQQLHNPEKYDFQKYDRIWQRVAPGLEPYPISGQESGAIEASKAVEQVPQQAMPGLTPMKASQEQTLPGADMNPCCMGSAAAEMLRVLTGFIEEELCDQREYGALARRAPSWARQQLRELAADAGGHARRLMAAYYLITGECYHPMIRCEPIRFGSWCTALRQIYHEEACNGYNYERAADETTDPCLSKLLQELSADEYHHAEILMTMLERSMRGN